MSNPVQINMYGIRYFIDGDLSDPHVKKLMVQARNDLQQMKGRNINNIPHTWLNRPNAYKVVSQFGIDSAYINVPVLVGEKYKKEREVFKIEKEESYRFVPAIILRGKDIATSGYITIPWQEVGDISVCATAEWAGVITIIKESPTAEMPGEIYNDGPITDTIEISACRNWGNRDIYIDFEHDEDRSVVNLDDPGFNPVPYADYPVIDLEAIKSPVIKTIWTIICDEVEEAYQECTDSPFYRCSTWHWDDADGDWTKTFLLVRHCMLSTFLWFKYKVDAYAQHYGPGGLCDECIHTEVVSLTTMGGAQSRFVTDYDFYAYYAYSDADWVEGRSAGEIVFGSPWYHYGDLTDNTYDLTLPSPCEPTQSDVIVLSEVYPLQYGVYGAYIQDQVDDDGEESQICPIPNFHDLYFILITEEWFEYARTSITDDWTIIGGPGYDEGGVYEHGVASNTLSDWNVSQDEYYRVLCMNLNGERIEIDRSDDIGDRFTNRTTDYFYATDALILDFMGTPVYMYGYMRTRYEGGKYQTVYTRYGYLLNGTHYQSEKFYPEGIVDWRGYTSCLHDVFGSVARDERYGFGQCAGFVVKEKTTKKGVTIREPDF